MAIDKSASLESPLLCWPSDHYYSPIANTLALSQEPTRSRVWPRMPPDSPGIDWRADEQVAFLRDELTRQKGFIIPDGPTGDPRDYHAANGKITRLDAWLLHAILRHFRPRRVIEVGCGWSSLVTARVNREYFDGQLDFTCIEPYPQDFLDSDVEGISRLIPLPVEDVSVEIFGELGAGDVLFIDSSHTVKTGGDVVFLLQEVLPRLAPGVVIHIHDIFLPWDYPEDWVMKGFSWNEQYAVRAFLAFNSAFKILLGVAWMSCFQPAVLATALASALPGYPGQYPDGGGSLWIQRNLE
jgi:Methyltransferase domain